VSAAARPDELPVFTQFYALLVWSFERAEAFPKVLRPTLTQRFLELLLQALELLLELRYSRKRQPLFARANMTLEKLRVLSRVLEARRAFSTRQYEHFNRELDSVGRQVGGWMKDSAARAHAARGGAGRAGNHR